MTLQRTSVGTDLQSLNELVYLATHDRGPIEARVASIQALEERGRAIELEQPTRVVVQRISGSGVFGDPVTRRPLLVYRGRVVDGPNANRVIHFLASQLEAPPPPPPVPARLNDKEQLVYRAARTALNAAKTRANQADLSIRDRVLARETEAALAAVARKNVVKRYELDAIIRRGDREDGVERRKAEANNPARLAAKAENQAMLGVIGMQLEAASVAFAAQAARQPGLRLPAPPGIPSFGPSAIINGSIGSPMDRNTYRDGGASVAPTRRGPNNH